jgi:hypothetical protein
MRRSWIVLVALASMAVLALVAVAALALADQGLLAPDLGAATWSARVVAALPAHPSGAHAAAGSAIGWLQTLFERLPLLLAAIVVVLVLPRPRPRQGAAQPIVGGALASRAIGVELTASLVALALLALVALPAALLLGGAAERALDLFLATVAVARGTAPPASSPWLYCGLFSPLAFIVLDVAIVALATTCFVVRARGFVAAVVRGRPIDSHRFWIWGSAGVAWTPLLPLVYISAALPVIRWLSERSLRRRARSRRAQLGHRPRRRPRPLPHQLRAGLLAPARRPGPRLPRRPRRRW